MPNTPKIARSLLAVLLGIGAASLLIFSEEVASAARAGALLAFSSVLPSLFPFLVASQLLIVLRVTHSAGRSFGGLMPLLFRQPREAASVLLLGLLSGYPVGAAAARSLYEEGGCTAEQAERLVALCNNSGPAFVVGVVGTALWGNARLGAALYLCHAAAALLSGILLSIGCPPVPDERPLPAAEPPSFFPALVRAVKSSALTALDIAAFIIFFSVVIALLPEVTSLPGQLTVGMLELTNGVQLFRSAEAALPVRLALQSFLLGFSGLSVFCQVAGVLEGSDLSLRPYLCGKLLQGAIALLLTLLLFPLFPQEVGVMLPLTPSLPLPAFTLLTALLLDSLLLWLAAMLLFSSLSCKRRTK
ncbi:MAG: sporulation protein [Clostridia bacterium]|nr:sporulation protein [Clostridia bacterium]